MSGKKRDIEVIVRELDARQQIHDVLMRYCRGNDHRHEGLVRSAYHPGATDDHGFFKGSAEDFIALVMGSGPECTNKLHVICNEYVEFDDTDLNLAYSETVVIGCMTRPSEDAYTLTFSSCRYLDRFECRDDVWRIVERQLVLDWEFETPSTGNDGTRLTTGMLRAFPTPRDPSFGLGFRSWGEGKTPVTKARTTGYRRSPTSPAEATTSPPEGNG